LIRQISNRHFPAGNPIANAIVVIVGIITIAAFIVLGIVAAVALAGVVLVLAAVLGIRMWWLGRKMPLQARTASRRGQSEPGDNTVIEGEFEIVSADPDENRPD